MSERILFQGVPLDRECSNCGGSGLNDVGEKCYECQGSGFELTDDGTALAAFIARHFPSDR